MTSRCVRILVAASAAAAIVPSGTAAAAAKKSAPYPTIAKVAPAKLGIGDALTITGKHFRSGKFRNTVVLKRDGGRAVFVRVAKATSTKIVITVPAKLLPFLKAKAGNPTYTRFRVRVLASRFGRTFTSLAKSPLIGPTAIGQPGTAAEGDCDHDGVLNGADTDDDNDLLPDTLEQSVKTNPCALDSDSDGVSDGFEYYSAIDLNSAALPYPGKRPYPNALDNSDANLDFDQDVLTLREEYEAWLHTGAPFPLTYSDGSKYAATRQAVTPATAWQDLDGNGFISDDEQDVDGDGLTNYDEMHGRMTVDWWLKTYKNEKPYPGPAYVQPNFVDPDTDGDGLKDGLDDQDHDGYTNAFEIARPFDWETTYVSTAHAGSNPLARVQPFNPCKPTYSDYCHGHPPFDYYQNEDWASPVYANGP